MCGEEIKASPLGDVCPACLLQPGLEQAEPDEDTSILMEREGDKIGRYTLTALLGEGGFGLVWEAEQLEPLRRRVALKILKAGMDTREVIARFRQERQALAMMDHPGIAQVFDAGATSAGRPYFVMELVPGMPVTEYWRRKQPPLEERLRLFMQIGAAVQHAHQKGIIHRDLKPSNILVHEQDGKAVVKIIDFGIAKAIEAPAANRALVTPMSRLLGTPAYMSPEQLDTSGLDVDTRSDIYSLGALLYEMLAGRPPFEPDTLAAAGQQEMLRVIREAEPPPPSARPGGGPWRSAMSADLDWIVMKCLEKDRARRYETVGGLVEDIRRHLDHEPVQARPPGAAYRLRKLVRRHQTACLAGLLIACSLIAGTVASTVQMLRARRAEALQKDSATQALAAEQRALSMLSQVTAAQERLRRENYRAQIQLAHGRLGGPLAHTVAELLRATEPELRGWEWGWLMAQCASPAWQMQMAGGPVRRVATDAAGARLFTASADGTLRAWSVAERRLLWEQPGGEIRDLASDRDGAYLAVIRRSEPPQSRLAILDGATGGLVHKRPRTNALHCVWEPNGRHLFITSALELFKLHVDSRKKSRSWPLEVITANQRDMVMDVAGTQVALVESWDGPWLLLDTKGLQTVLRVPGPRPAREFGAAWLDTAAGWEVCSFDRGLYRVSREGEPSFSLIYTHPVFITHLAAVDEDHLVVAGDDHLAEIRQDGTVTRRQRLSQRVTAICASQEGDIFLAGEGGLVWRWEGVESELAPVSRQIMDPVGGRFLSFEGGGEHLLMFRHALPQPFLIALEAGGEPAMEPAAPCVHDSTGKITYRHAQGLPCRNPATGEVVTAGAEELHFHRLREDGSWEKRAHSVDGLPYSAAFDRDGRFMLVATSEGASLHDLRNRTVTPAPIPCQGGLVDLTSDGRLALLLHDRRACVWETATGKVLLDRVFRAQLVGALHPAGEALAISARSQEILLLPLQPGREEKILRAAGRWPHVLRFSSDGERLYTAGPENKLWWFDWRLGRELLVLDEICNISDAALSPDGRTLATCGPGVAAHLRVAAP